MSSRNCSSRDSRFIGAAAGIGAIAGGADDATVAALALCGIRLGMAFQIQDDVLGIWGEAAETGKSTSDDIRARKKSFPVVYAFDQLEGDARDALMRSYGEEASDGDVQEVLTLLESARAREAAT